MDAEHNNLQVTEEELTRFYQCLEPYLPFVYRLICSRLRDQADAQDVFQDTVLQALCNLHQLRSQDCTRAWLVRIAINEVHKIQRQKYFEPTLYSIDQQLLSDDGEAPVAEEIADCRETPCEQLERKELTTIFQQILGCLPEKQRQVLILCDLQHLSASEVAKLLKVSTSEVRSSLHRARYTLRELLDPIFHRTVRAPHRNVA